MALTDKSALSWSLCIPVCVCVCGACVCVQTTTTLFTHCTDSTCDLWDVWMFASHGTGSSETVSNYSGHELFKSKTSRREWTTVSNATQLLNSQGFFVQYRFLCLNSRHSYKKKISKTVWATAPPKTEEIWCEHKQSAVFVKDRIRWTTPNRSAFTGFPVSSTLLSAAGWNVSSLGPDGVLWSQIDGGNCSETVNSAEC